MSYELCIPISQLCNGIPQCPDGSDEDLDRCLDYFPTNTASDTRCDAPDIFNNQTVRIIAVRCDGKVECKDGSDEEGCKVDKTFLFITNKHTYEPNMYGDQMVR